MDHKTDSTASQEGTNKDDTIADETATGPTTVETGPPALENVEQDYSEAITNNLVIFKGQFKQLKEEIHAHIQQIRDGTIQPKDVKDVKTAISSIEPLLNQSMQQEIKIHEKLAQRLGKAGQHAVDLGDARSEVGRRLARIRDAAGDA